jgi:hypothetical protein
MQQKSIRLQITNPCTEKIADMTPTARGRYCSACQRDVQDFTNLTDAELVDLFLKAADQEHPPCGFYRSDQLDRDIFAPAHRSNRHAWRAIGMLLAGYLGITQAEGQTTEGKQPVQVIQNDTIKPAQEKNWEARARTVEGKVVSLETRSPLYGCRVSLTDSIVTYCNKEGGFSILVPSEFEDLPITLKFYCFGYLPHEIVFQNPKDELPASLQIKLETGLTIAARKIYYYDSITTGLTSVSIKESPKSNLNPSLWQRLKHFFRPKSSPRQ